MKRGCFVENTMPKGKLSTKRGCFVENTMQKGKLSSKRGCLVENSMPKGKLSTKRGCFVENTMQNHVMGNSVDKTMNDIRVCTARASFALNSHKVYYKSYKNAIFDDRLSDFWLL